jgi:hypothetical protein
VAGNEIGPSGCYAQFMAIFLCRWPNGEFSLVNAKTKDDAIELLDEWGNAEQASLTRMSDCMFDFRLDDEGQIELADIGEATQDHIMRTCYPELEKTLEAAEWDDTGLAYSAKSHDQIREAVESERKRLWNNQPPVTEAQTDRGRQIQKQTGAASVVINRIMRTAATKRLQSKEGAGKKPN